MDGAQARTNRGRARDQSPPSRKKRGKGGATPSGTLMWKGWASPLHGIAAGAALFGQEEIRVTIAVGSAIAHKIMCGTFFDIEDAPHP